jgi:hypothetical protein
MVKRGISNEFPDTGDRKNEAVEKEVIFQQDKSKIWLGLYNFYRFKRLQTTTSV